MSGLSYTKDPALFSTALINDVSSKLSIFFSAGCNQQSFNCFSSNIFLKAFFQVPQLSPGISVKLSCMGHLDPTIIQQPTVNELPLLDVYLIQVMGLVGGAKNLLILLTSLLLEHQILLISEGKYCAQHNSLNSACCNF